MSIKYHDLESMIKKSEGACQMIFLVKGILLYAIEWGGFVEKLLCVRVNYYHMNILLQKYFTQCQAFDCLYRAKSIAYK